MVETVLTDQHPQSSHDRHSTRGDCVISSLNSSKDPDSGVVAYPSGVSRQGGFQDITLESDLVSSSFSLPGGSPTSLLRRGSESKQISTQSILDSSNSERERFSYGDNRPNLRREDSEVRRWKYANSRSLRYGSQFDRRSSHMRPRNSLISYCLEDDQNQSSLPVGNSIIDLNALSGLKRNAE